MIRRIIDWRSPLAAFAPLAESAGAALLHGGDSATAARWSFIVAAPSSTILCDGRGVFVDGEPVAISPFEALSALHRGRRISARATGAAPFASGLVGFCGYECARFVEPGVAFPPSPFALPDFQFGAYDAVAAFDRDSREAFIFGRTAGDAESLERRLGRDDAPVPEETAFGSPTSNFSRDAYLRAVADVIGKIRNGDFFQANISQRIETSALQDFRPFDLFRAASSQSAAAFGAYFPAPAGALMSLSPERFFSATADAQGRFRLTAEPIKGTRPRGATPAEDARLLAELVADPKDRAENIMIADLTRNDLSRICDDHSISEDAICEPASFAGVHHLVSRLSGRLRGDLNAADALGAMFPCGSITGAPKVEAMKTIAAVEGAGRGPYCGAIGYIDDAGAADFSVAIRIALAEGRRISIPVGGGVTLRSDPRSEYDETLAKAAQFMRRLNLEEAALK